MNTDILRQAIEDYERFEQEARATYEKLKSESLMTFEKQFQKAMAAQSGGGVPAVLSQQPVSDRERALEAELQNIKEQFEQLTRAAKEHGLA